MRRTIGRACRRVSPGLAPSRVAQRSPPPPLLTPGDTGTEKDAPPLSVFAAAASHGCEVVVKADNVRRRGAYPTEVRVKECGQIGTRPREEPQGQFNQAGLWREHLNVWSRAGLTYSLPDIYVDFERQRRMYPSVCETHGVLLNRSNSQLTYL